MKTILVFLVLCLTVTVHGQLVNVAIGKDTNQLSTGSWCGGSNSKCAAAYAVDGVLCQDPDNCWCTHTQNTNEWWRVNLGQQYKLVYIVAYMRNDDSSLVNRLDGTGIFASNTNVPLDQEAQQVGTITQTMRQANPNNNQIYQFMVSNTIAAMQYIEMRNPNSYITICEMQVFAGADTVTNVALGKFATASSNDNTCYGIKAPCFPAYATDGNTTQTLATGYCFSSQSRGQVEWWRVDLGDNYNLSSIILSMRTDPGYASQSLAASVYLSGSATPLDPAAVKIYTILTADGKYTIPMTPELGTIGRYLEVRSNWTALTICELEAIGSPANQPCLGYNCNNGTCVPTAFGSPSCSCNKGYTGKNCDTEICSILNCGNHAICRVGICYCRDGWTQNDGAIFGDGNCSKEPPHKGQPACNNFTRYAGSDFNGYDIRHTDGLPTVDECQEWCQATPNCYAFEYHPDGNCWAKAAAALGHLESSGNNIAGGCSKVPDDKCVGIVCNNGGTCREGMCHCVGGHTGGYCENEPAQDPSCNTFTRLDDYDLGGDNVASINGINEYSDCQNYCQSSKGCYGFVWNSNGKNCWAKNLKATGTPNSRPGQNLVSGQCADDLCKILKVDCGPHGVCRDGGCHCIGGYSGDGCVTSPPGGQPTCANFTKMEHTDYMGFDISDRQDIYEWADCINYCQATANCYAIEFSLANHRCWAKTYGAVLAGPRDSDSDAGVCTTAPASDCQGINCKNNGACRKGVCHCVDGYLGAYCDTAPPQAPACSVFDPFPETGLAYSNSIASATYGLLEQADCENFCKAQTNCFAYTWDGTNCNAKVMEAMDTKQSTAGTFTGICHTDPCKLMGLDCKNGGSCSAGKCHCRNGWTGTTCMTPPPGNKVACTNFSHTIDTDYTGNDLQGGVGSITTWADCENLCQSLADCYAYEYVTSSTTCYPKGAAALYVVPSASAGNMGGACTYKPPNPCQSVNCQNGGTCDNGICRCAGGYTGKYCTTKPNQDPICTDFERLEKTDLTNTNNIGTQYGSVTYTDCLNYCQSQANCWVFAWTGSVCYARGAPAYGTTTTGTTAAQTMTVGRCKTDPCTKVNCGTNGGVCVKGACHCRNGYSGDTCQTAPPGGKAACGNFTLYPDSDLNGYDLQSNNAITSVADCQNYCQSVERCYAFEYNPSSTTCYVKGAAALGPGPITANGNTAGGCTTKPDQPCLGVKCGTYGSCLDGVCHCTQGYTDKACGTRPAQKPACTSFTQLPNTDTVVAGTIGTAWGIMTIGDCENYCESQKGCYMYVYSGTTCYVKGGAAWGGGLVTEGKTTTTGICKTDPCETANCGTHGAKCVAGACRCRNGYTGDTCSTAPPGGSPSCKGEFIQVVDKDFNGFDLRNDWGGITTYEDCVNYCQATANCYVAQFQPSNNACWAKAYAAIVAGPIQQAGSISGTCSVAPPSPCDGIRCGDHGTCKDGACHCTGGYSGATCQNAPARVPTCASFAELPYSDLSYTDNINTGYGLRSWADCANYCQQQQGCWAFVSDGVNCYPKVAAAYATVISHTSNSVGRCVVDPCTATVCNHGGSCSEGICHCKGGYTGATCDTQPPNGHPSCESFTAMPDQDFNGYDLASSSGRVYSYDDCVNFCQATANCYAAEFNPSSHSCWAKGYAAVLAGPKLANGNTAAKCLQVPPSPCLTVTCKNGGSCDNGVCHCVGGHTGPYCETNPAQKPACLSFARFDQQDTGYTTNLGTMYGCPKYEDCVNYCESQNGCYAFTWDPINLVCYAKANLAMGTQTSNANNVAGICNSPDMCSNVQCNNGGSCLYGLCHCKNGYSGSACTIKPPNEAPSCSNFTRWEGYDFYGSDLQNSNAAMLTYEDCLNYCQSTANCYAFHWSPANPHVCYAKGAAALSIAKIVSANSVSGGCANVPSEVCRTVVCKNGASCANGMCHCINGYTGTQCQTAPAQQPACLSFKRLENADFSGGQTITTTYGIITYGDCLNMCEAANGCYAFVWTGQICYAKSAFALSTQVVRQDYIAGACDNVDVCKNIDCGAHGKCVSGICRCTPGWGGARCLNKGPDNFCKNFTTFPGIDFTSNDLSNVANVFTIEDCILNCQATAKCTVVSLSSNTCYMKSAAAYGTKNPVANIIGAACVDIQCTGTACNDLCVGVTCPGEHMRCLLGACVCKDGYSGSTCGSPPPSGACLGAYTPSVGTDLPVGEVGTEGGTDFDMCISKCQGRADCVAVTRDNGGICHFRNVSALEVTAPKTGFSAATCDKAMSMVQPGTTCTGVTCNNGATCLHGACYCAGGYNGKKCDSAPPAGVCSNFVVPGVNLTLVGATAYGPTGGFDAINTAACINRCQMYPACRYATLENYNCKLFALKAGASTQFKVFSTVVSCYDIWPTAKARFTVAYNNQPPAQFQPLVEQALASLSFGPETVETKIVYAANGTAQVTLICKLQTCDFATLGTSINARSGKVGDIVISNFLLWCPSTADKYVSSLSQCNGGESSSSSLSGGAVAGIVIAVVVVVAIAGLVFFYTYTGSRSFGTSGKKKRAKRTGSGSDLSSSTSRGVELPNAGTNTTLLPNDMAPMANTPKASLYSVAPDAGKGTSPAPPPLPPMPRM